LNKNFEEIREKELQEGNFNKHLKSQGKRLRVVSWLINQLTMPVEAIKNIEKL
jgi:hypothetical protein